MRSQISITKAMSCSMRRIVMPNSSRSRRISAASAWVSRGFIPAAGSSSSTTLGSVASARAISSRRWSP
jgi:hypothetical protein